MPGTLVNEPQSAPLLVSVHELARHLGEPGWVVVDCRFDLLHPEAGESAWRREHIPGAHYAHLDRDLASAPGPVTGRHPLPHPDKLALLFSSWGVTPQTRVVAYDESGGAVAARLWWLLRWMGHGLVSLLDGGLAAWKAAGLPLSGDPPRARAGIFVGAPGHMPVVTTAEVEERLAAGCGLIDARSSRRFLGLEEPIDPVPGHVPGAVNVPFQNTLLPDGRFRPASELRAAFDQALAGRPPDRLAVMCGSGVTACHVLFALELAGLPGAALYAGSWSEWIRSPQRPVAVTDSTGTGA